MIKYTPGVLDTTFYNRLKLETDLLEVLADYQLILISDWSNPRLNSGSHWSESGGALLT